MCFSMLAFSLGITQRMVGTKISSVILNAEDAWEKRLVIYLSPPPQN